MLRSRDYNSDEIAPMLPRGVRERFLRLEPAEQNLLINGTDEEREQYGWLAPDAAKKYAKLNGPDRVAEAKELWRARRLERQPPPPRSAPVKPQGWQPPDLGRAAELCESSARIAETARDIFELPRERFEGVQSLAINHLQAGANEEQALDRVAAVLLDDVTLPACEAPPSRLRVMLGAGNVIRG